jgi:hypothetical protein
MESAAWTAKLEQNDSRRCVATNSRGEQCRKFAIAGATVCRTHGGAVKRIREAARIRVENASNRLMGKLIEFAFDDTKPPDVQLKAIQNSLDRAGLKPPAEITLSQGETKPYEEIFEGIAGGSREESRRRRGYIEGTPDEFALANESAQPDGPAQTDHLLQPPQAESFTPSGGDDGDVGPRQPRSDRQRRNQRIQQTSGHVTGDAAIEMAAQARDLPGGHRLYPRP